MFTKILIANRGEIACRIARTAHDMGIKTVAVFSDADQFSLHVKACGEAIHIGAPAPGESYLDINRIVQAAKDVGANAIHPGYGFLSENAEFAQSCADNSIVFIGPKPNTIVSMGSKSAARKIMQKAGVPVLPGYDGNRQDEAYLSEQASKIGYPLLIKAVSGGGGKGLRAVEQASDFLPMLNAVKRESLGAFGDDAVLLERYLPNTRHIEIQIITDTHGSIVHLFERDCSLQRRHQKVLEEAPALDINTDLRAAMVKTAINCAYAIDYIGAGTVEFLLAPDQRFYFMEMNTRLQVEHPVTEMITGIDLVAWQLKIAAGEKLPEQQSKITSKGHAIEVRIYAEDPSQHFLPSSGQLEYLCTPARSTHTRIDTGVTEGDEISPYYDPMIAKLICWGKNRDQALTRLRYALKQYQLIGPKNNILFLSTLCAQPAVIAGSSNTRFIENNVDQLCQPPPSPGSTALIAATVHWLRQCAFNISARQSLGDDPDSPWAESDSWRIGAKTPQTLQFTSIHQADNAKPFSLSVLGNQASWDIDIDGKQYSVEHSPSDPPRLNLNINGQVIKAIVVSSNAQIRVLIKGQCHPLVRLDAGAPVLQHHQQNNQILSPMPGKLIICDVKVGSSVNRGQILMVIEAMKMEHTILATQKACIANIHVRINDQVEEGDLLLEFEP